MIIEIARGEASLSFVIQMTDLAVGLRKGASVSVSGVCLTVVEAEGELVQFDVMGETLQKTNLGLLEVGDDVNLERSYHVGDEVGGHIVSGHVSTTATIASIQKTEENFVIEFKMDPRWSEYLFPKGFIALDGCSLTLVDVMKDGFSVHLIPETLRLTTFANKKVGDKVNVEPEAQTVTMVETVKRYLANKS